jgi:hypothetical protein
VRLDLPAKCRAPPFRNVWIIDALKVEKACLQDPGKIRTSVAGHGGEQTHCFHDRHISGSNLGKCIFFELGSQQRLPLDNLHQQQRRPPAIVPRIPAARKIKSEAGASRHGLFPSNVALRAPVAPRSQSSGDSQYRGARAVYLHHRRNHRWRNAIHLFASPRTKPTSKGTRTAVKSSIVLTVPARRGPIALCLDRSGGIRLTPGSGDWMDQSRIGNRARTVCEEGWRSHRRPCYTE